jgi:hypothetical protein
LKKCINVASSGDGVWGEVHDQDLIEIQHHEQKIATGKPSPTTTCVSNTTIFSVPNVASTKRTQH